IRSRAEKMRAIFPGAVAVSDQLQPRLVHQRGWLESLSRRFTRHARGGHPAQFVVNNLEQFLACKIFTAARGMKQQCEIVHRHASYGWEMGWAGLEPATNALKGRCSTIELPTRKEAKGGLTNAARKTMQADCCARKIFVAAF